MKHFQAIKLPRSIWAIGLMTLLMNISTVIVFSLQPEYLVHVLGFSALGLGVLEGTVEFMSWLTRVFSGAISDALRRRKPLLIAAVSLTAIARPLFALSTSMVGIFTARTLDRIGNGLQASPRDALIGDAAPAKHRGQAFGLRQALGMVGSALGALLTIYWMKNGYDDYKTVFWIAAIFPLLAFVLVLYYVKDHTHVSLGQHPHQSTPKTKRKVAVHLYNIGTLERDYWFVLIVAALYMMTQYSGTFIILHGTAITGLKTIGPQIMLAQNVCAMLIAYPLGRLFDQMNHRLLLALGLVVVIAANFAFNLASNTSHILLGAALWGVQIGMIHAILAAKISSTTVETNRGTGFGIYYIASGSAIFLSNAVIGKVAEVLSLSQALLLSALMAGIAIACLPLMKKN
jgi:predicted MFS family arabinose efflux permease